MDPGTLIGLILSALAIVVAVASSVRSNAIAAEQTRIQERLLRLEARREAARNAAAQKAILSGQIVPSGNSRKLLISNIGEAKATNVDVTTDNRPVLEHDLVPKGVTEIREVAPGGTIPYLLATHMGSPSVVSVRVTWEDDSGVPGEWSSTLAVFG
jgi:hypothetical protein